MRFRLWARPDGQDRFIPRTGLTLTNAGKERLMRLRKAPPKPGEIGLGMQRVMQSNCAVFRTAEILAEGVAKIEQVAASYADIGISDRSMIWNSDLVEALEKKKLDMSWFCLSRAQNLIRDADLVSRLRRVGLYQVLIGIDGGTDEEIAEAHKGPMKVGVKELKELIQFLRRNDISTIATYLNGFWDDDEAKIKQRARAVDEIDPDIVMIQLLNPIPGSPIYKRAVKENVIEINNLSLYDLEHCVMPTQHLSRQRLGELTGWAFQSFYGKPGRVDRILNGYSSPYVKMKFLSFKENAAKYEKGAAEDAVAI